MTSNEEFGSFLVKAAGSKGLCRVVKSMLHVQGKPIINNQILAWFVFSAILLKCYFLELGFVQ